jgi:hypothetical protein
MLLWHTFCVTPSSRDVDFLVMDHVKEYRAEVCLPGWEIPG